MISQVDGPPCWVLPLTDDGDLIHLPNRPEALKYAAANDIDPAQLHQLPVPCWVAVCAGDGCIAVEVDEDGNATHIPAYTRRHALVDLVELVNIDDQLLCIDCRDRMYPPAEPQSPATGRPTIVTYDDLGRAFGLLLHLVDETPGEQLFDPDSHNVIALVESFVTRQPPAVPGGWAMCVGPFVVQPPLPDMPTPPIGGRTR